MTALDALMPTHAKLAKKALAAQPATHRYQLHAAVLERIWLERLRQRDHFHSGRHNFSVASPVVSNDRKLRVITEELGEVAQEIDKLEAITKGRTESDAAFRQRLGQRRGKLQDELTQLVAVGVAWLESMEEEQ